MAPDEAEELRYLAAGVVAAKVNYDAAVKARNEYMRRLDRRRVPLHEIAAEVGLSSPQTLRIVTKEVPDAD